MHPAHRDAEEAFRHHIFSRCRGDLPALLAVSVAFIVERDEVCFQARFNGDLRIHSILNRCPNYRRIAREVQQNARQFESECRSLYARMYDDHLIQVRVEPMRERVREFSRISANPAEISSFANHIERQIDEIMRGHRYNLPPNYINSSGNFCDAIVFDEAAQIDLRPGAVNWFDGSFLTFGGDADVGSKKARARGLALLKAWLSPEQLAQFAKDKSFEVIGQASGKRYRIRHGRQINIDELDAAGAMVCMWCFLPEGQLVAGDVMLAQKIALETDEAAALRVANQFGASPPRLCEEQAAQRRWLTGRWEAQAVLRTDAILSSDATS